MTIHPDASGRPHALLMHERLIEHINKHEGVEWVTMGQVCLLVNIFSKPYVLKVVTRCVTISKAPTSRHQGRSCRQIVKKF
jgi:hypothetical protein